MKKFKRNGKEIEKSIKSQIIATGITPLLAMSTAVSILSLGDEIRTQTQVCDASRAKITKYIEDLRRTSEKSVYSTEGTLKSVTELNQNINEIESSAQLLKEYAETLNNQVQYFSVGNHN